MADREFYVRYLGTHGAGFVRIEILPSGRLCVVNETTRGRGEHERIDHSKTIIKEVILSGIVFDELREIIAETGILGLDDASWPLGSGDSEEIEVVLGDDHVSFTTDATLTTAAIEASADPRGLRAFRAFGTAIKELATSLTRAHYNPRPI
eukprot:Amastigsp_a683326_75.p2 type:complete len:151 gc:universal Amastigsp_a683326_75:685-233(-)